MGLEFSTIRNETPGVVASPLKRSYAALAASEPSLWRGEQARWDQHGRDVFRQLDTVGASVFLTRFDGSIVGFAGTRGGGRNVASWGTTASCPSVGVGASAVTANESNPLLHWSTPSAWAARCRVMGRS